MIKYRLMIKNTYINFTMPVHLENAGIFNADEDINKMYGICAKFNSERTAFGKFTYWVEEDDQKLSSG